MTIDIEILSISETTAEVSLCFTARECNQTVVGCDGACIFTNANEVSIFTLATHLEST